MSDVTVVESERKVAVLSQEEVREAASLLQQEIKTIVSSWSEYKTARELNQTGILEFQRSKRKGVSDEGLWEVENVGGYSRYQLTRGVKKGLETFVEDWEVVLQPGGTGVYKDSIISANRIMTKDGQVIGKESPPNNTRGSLNLAIEFARYINGGEIPPALSVLAPSNM